MAARSNLYIVMAHQRFTTRDGAGVLGRAIGTLGYREKWLTGSLALAPRWFHRAGGSVIFTRHRCIEPSWRGDFWRYPAFILAVLRFLSAPSSPAGRWR